MSQTLSQAACDLWRWCLQRGITLSAVHLPGVQNSTADGESRTSAEWMLERSICHSVIQTLGPCSVDLLAIHLNNQLGRYVSWCPDMSGMHFPDRQKVRQEGCTLVLVTSVWDVQPWYLLLPPHDQLLVHPLVARYSRLEVIRKTYLAEGISERASELIQSGWNKGTNTAYQSGWATKRQIDPISGGCPALSRYFSWPGPTAQIDKLHQIGRINDPQTGGR